MRRALHIAPLVCVLACGRLGFDPSDPGPAPDVVTTLAASGSSRTRAMARTSRGLVVIGSFDGDIAPCGALVTASGGTDAFVWWLDDDGTCELLTFGGAGDDFAHEVAVAETDELVLVGEFRQVVQFGATQLTAQATRDAFLIDVAPDRTIAWAQRIPGNSNDDSYELVGGVSLDRDRIHVLGRVWGQDVAFGWGGPVDMLSDSGFGDAYIMRVGRDGSYVATYGFGTGGGEHVYGGIITGENDDLYLGGTFGASGDVDPGPGTRAGGVRHEGFLMKVIAGEQFDWINVASAGGWNPVMMSAFCGTTSLVTVREFGFEPFRTAIAQHDRTTCALIWQRLLVPEPSLYRPVRAITCDAAGNVYVTGSFGAPIDFDPADDAMDLRTPVAEDLFITSLDAAGAYRWTDVFSSTGGNAIVEIVAMDVDDLIVTGSFSGSLAVDDDQIIEAPGLRESFILRHVHH